MEVIVDNVTPNTIWNEKQNIPELIVQDIIAEFDLPVDAGDKIRMILLRRGVNKWLWARRLFIQFKHEIKDQLKDAFANNRPERKLLQSINARMQNIAKIPRWVEWPPRTHNWKKIEPEIVIRGRRC